MIFAEVIANKSFSKGKPFRTRPYIYLQSRPQGAFPWLCRWRPTSREKSPEDEVVLFSLRKELSQTNKASKLIIALYPVLMGTSSSSYRTFSFSLFFISYNLKFQPSVILFHVLKPI